MESYRFFASGPPPLPPPPTGFAFGDDNSSVEPLPPRDAEAGTQRSYGFFASDPPPPSPPPAGDGDGDAQSAYDFFASAPPPAPPPPPGRLSFDDAEAGADAPPPPPPASPPGPPARSVPATDAGAVEPEAKESLESEPLPTPAQDEHQDPFVSFEPVTGPPDGDSAARGSFWGQPAGVCPTDDPFVTIERGVGGDASPPPPSPSTPHAAGTAETDSQVERGRESVERVAEAFGERDTCSGPPAPVAAADGDYSSAPLAFSVCGGDAAADSGAGLTGGAGWFDQAPPDVDAAQLAPSGEVIHVPGDQPPEAPPPPVPRALPAFPEAAPSARTFEDSSLRADLEHARRERDVALAQAAQMRSASGACAAKEGGLRAEIERLRAELARSDARHQAMTDAFHERLRAAEEPSRALLDSAATEVRGDGASSGVDDKNVAVQREVDELRVLLDAEARRADACDEQVAATRTRLSRMSEERDALLGERASWVLDEAALSEKERASAARLVDVECRLAAVTAERAAALERCEAATAHVKQLGGQFDRIVEERDGLVALRTAGAPPAVAELEADRERLARNLSTVQRQLVGAMSKIDKLSAQRRKYQQQRDDAGARLRAAGADFQGIQDRLAAQTAGRAQVTDKIASAVAERDVLSSQLAEATRELRLREGVEAELAQLKSEAAKAAEASSGRSAALAERVKALEQRLAAADSSLMCANAKAALSSEEAAGSRARSQHLDAELAARAQEAQLLRTASEDAHGRQAVLRAELDAWRADAARDVARAATSRARLDAELQGVRLEVAALRDQVAIQQSTIACSSGTLKQLLGDPELRAASFADGTESVASSPHSFFSSASGPASVTSRAKNHAGDVSAELPAAAEDDVASLAARMATVVRSMSSDSRRLVSRASQLSAELETVQDRLAGVEAERDHVQAALTAATADMSAVRSSTVAKEDADALARELDDCVSQLDAVWRMVEKFALAQTGWMGLGLGGLGGTSDSASRGNVVGAVEHALGELERSTQACVGQASELEASSANVADLTERAELAEGELELARKVAADVERRIVVERERAGDDVKSQYDRGLAAVEDDLRAAREELASASKVRARLEAECEDLRGLNSSLTSQFNSRTNELDDAEEKVAYLQDQLATLEEDVEDARRTSQSRVAETAQARRADVDRLTDELQRERGRNEELQEAVAGMESELEHLQVSEREATLLAATHRQAENNMHIAIEQMEAERESELARRTAELRRDLDQAREGGEGIPGMQDEAQRAARRIAELDAEVLEQRAALGRLADERVELKLELEEKLSRLNHPDAGGQLVDRRVVRQLLVSYFRVDSLRRQDVLDLMSRMLAFSDDDLVAVGIKRRPLMERLGSVVKAPQYDGSFPPPVGSVSEKWIEFLINASDEHDENDDDF
jgi:chromosome segregation ATPase